MLEEFKIYIDRLKDGSVQKIEGEFEPIVLGVEEEHLQFSHPIEIDAESYTTDDHLVINLSASTRATMPCSICSEQTTTVVACDHAYITVPIDEIKGAVYDFKQALREGLLIEVPHVTECHGGKCPGRKTLERYFRVNEEKIDEPIQSPFNNIDLDQ